MWVLHCNKTWNRYAVDSLSWYCDLVQKCCQHLWLTIYSGQCGSQFSLTLWFNFYHYSWGRCFSSEFNRWGNRSSEKLTNFTKIAQLVRRGRWEERIQQILVQLGQWKGNLFLQKVYWWDFCYIPWYFWTGWDNLGIQVLLLAKLINFHSFIHSSIRLFIYGWWIQIHSLAFSIN